MSAFIDMLNASHRRRGSLLCVGLDPLMERIPRLFRRHRQPLFAFNREIIDATAPWACAFKPQIAHYAAHAAEAQLQQTIDHIKQHHPDTPVILDAKRGDIGATAKLYAAEAFDRYAADAVTVNPYLGFDALAPFVERADKGVFVLCRTSNPGSGELQALLCDGVPLAHRVAALAAGEWNANRNLGLVVGATWPQEVAAIRQIAAEMPLLIPGVGAQGGDLAAVLGAALTADDDAANVLISVSRGVMYAGDLGSDSSSADFATAAATASEDLCREINRHRRL